MSATEIIHQIKSLPEEERVRVYEFVLHEQKPDWAKPRPPGYFADCYSADELDVVNWFADQGPKAIVP